MGLATLNQPYEQVDPTQVVAGIRSAIGVDEDHSFQPLHVPHFEGTEWEYVKDCLDTGWVSSVGSYVERFESEVAAQSGVAHGVAVVNGTAALQIALEIVGVGVGDEVLMPALTFVATPNAASYLGAIPHFVDSDPTTLGLDPVKLDLYLHDVAERSLEGVRNRLTGRRLGAIVPMHTYGHPVDMEPLIAIAARHGIPIVEDAAESLGSVYKGEKCGSLGRVAAISFNGNKIITTGGGGAIVTDDADLAARAKHLTTTAKVTHRWAFDHDAVGYNFRLPNLNAALGCAQLESLPSYIERKRSLAERYVSAFESIAGVSAFRERCFGRANYWLNCLLLDEPSIETRDAVLEATNDAGLMTRPTWTLMKDLPMYVGAPSMPLDGARNIEARLINVPSSVPLGENPC
ncbi:LegC family aminotransferase [Parvibaculaceae bacterium PLY_AMNH_Bact1]|nr:LegC family aminotransferase [Parvibaculaceae bacterium PLY_AMNH_Bact1]